MNMVNGIMKPMLNGQPGLFEPSLQFIVNQTTLHLTAVNLLIGIVQVCLGLGFLFLPDRWVKELVIVSIVWALIVWYGGEGMSMLLTGTASILTGAPGAVLLYPLLGFAVYPRKTSTADAQSATRKAGDDGLLPRKYLRWVLAGFWIFGALLQLQPNWWQPGQISQTIGGYIGMGGLNTWLVDPVLKQISTVTANIEIPLNIALIVAFLALGIGLAVVRREQLPPFLIASIVVSVVFWYCSEAFGGILTGMATDFNSGLLVVVMALAVWPKASALQTSVRARVARELRETGEPGTAQRA
ncbi:MAG TPA: hypothetical protein VJQ26_12820 [Ktedonobacteraceae bacterium]|nr:hypothetical protein [Ktedonobacteraceae bacterium]